jgi:hypothetical protein
MSQKRQCVIPKRTRRISLSGQDIFTGFPTFFSIDINALTGMRAAY